MRSNRTRIIVLAFVTQEGGKEERGMERRGGFSPSARNNRNYVPTIYNSELPFLPSVRDFPPLLPPPPSSRLPSSPFLPCRAQLNVITSVVADNFPRLFAGADSRLRSARPETLREREAKPRQFEYARKLRRGARRHWQK